MVDVILADCIYFYREKSEKPYEPFTLKSRSNDGWKQWKDQEGHLIEIFRAASRAGKKRVCSNSTEKSK